jgi:hypothetical protein
VHFADGGYKRWATRDGSTNILQGVGATSESMLLHPQKPALSVIYYSYDLPLPSNESFQ